MLIQFTWKYKLKDAAIKSVTALWRSGILNALDMRQAFGGKKNPRKNQIMTTGKLLKQLKAIEFACTP